LYSVNSDFSDTLKPELLQTQIESNSGITPTCTHIDTKEDDVKIWFDAELGAGEDTTLNAVVSAHSPLPKNTTDVFDAIVDARYNGDYISIAAAFADGHTSVYVRDGVYVETSDINLPSGGQLIGESQGNVKIVMPLGHSVKIDGSNGVKESTGTISSTNGSQIIIGIGTTFTNLNVGNYILIGTNFYPIGAIADDVTIYLAFVYRGKNISDFPMMGLPMHTGCKISNIVVANGSGTGLYCRGISHCSIRGVAIINCARNVHIIDSGDSSFCEFICGFSGGIGITLENVHSVLCDTLEVYNSVSDGIKLTGTSSSNIFDSCPSTNNGGKGIHITGNIREITLTGAVIKHNGEEGIYSTSGSNKIVMVGCSIVANEGNGVDFSGLSNVITGNIIEANGKDGIIGGSDCVISGNQILNNAKHGVYHASGTNGCSISGNRIINNTTGGIDILTDNCVISNNIIDNNGVYGIEVSGSNNNMCGNNISNNPIGISVTSTAVDTLMMCNQVFDNTNIGLSIGTNAVLTFAGGNIIKNNTNSQITDNGINTVKIYNASPNLKMYERTIVTTSSYTVLYTDSTLTSQYTATGSSTITLTPASGNHQKITIIDESGNANTNPITINTQYGDTIIGNATYSITENYGSVTLYSDANSKWMIGK
jgi:parallel beta-helix repeat protein